MKPLDDGLKQRLIGAIVLLALGVIFLPVLFDRSPIAPVDRESQVPAAPNIVTVELPVADSPEVEAPAPDPESMYVPDETEVVDLTPEPAGLDQQGVPKSWVLQVASFRSQKAAEALRSKLVENGFAAYTRQLTLDEESHTRVLVGPKLDKSALMRDKEKIQDAFSLSAILLEFDP